MAPECEWNHPFEIPEYLILILIFPNFQKKLGRLYPCGMTPALTARFQSVWKTQTQRLFSRFFAFDLTFSLSPPKTACAQFIKYLLVEIQTI
jgi:hypothetical protein